MPRGTVAIADGVPSTEHVDAAPLAPQPAMPPVLYDDEHLLAVNKPAGLVTHPAYKHPDGTLADAVFAFQAGRGEGRPWLLHRLDRETSGVVLFAKTDQARRALVRQFERRLVAKRYLVLVSGTLPSSVGIVEAPLARDAADRRRVIVTPSGQAATTHYRALAHAGEAALLLVEPLTGRTHQIRVHLAALGAPLVGDVLYGGAETCGGLCVRRTMLHAWQLDIRYPASGVPLTIAAPLPDDLLALTRALGLDVGRDGALQSV